MGNHLFDEGFGVGHVSGDSEGDFLSVGGESTLGGLHELGGVQDGSVKSG